MEMFYKLFTAVTLPQMNSFSSLYTCQCLQMRIQSVFISQALVNANITYVDNAMLFRILSKYTFLCQ